LIRHPAKDPTNRSRAVSILRWDGSYFATAREACRM
jgi:hypothetical protein